MFSLTTDKILGVEKCINYGSGMNIATFKDQTHQSDIKEVALEHTTKTPANGQPALSSAPVLEEITLQNRRWE